MNLLIYIEFLYNVVSEEIRIGNLTRQRTAALCVDEEPHYNRN
jgi:hypothetical protein